MNSTFEKIKRNYESSIKNGVSQYPEGCIVTIPGYLWSIQWQVTCNHDWQESLESYYM